METVVRESLRYWLSNDRMTVGVTVDGDGIIRIAAPIVKMFIGQPIENLIRWMRRRGELTAVCVDDPAF